MSDAGFAASVRFRRRSVSSVVSETHTMSDPRIFFAAERTLLAWIRSGIATMGFGFVVARFGLFLRLLAAQRADVEAGSSAFTGFSNCVGVGLILLGVASMFIAALQHRSFLVTLPSTDIPPSHRHHFAVVVAYSLGVLGLALAAYLVL